MATIRDPNTGQLITVPDVQATGLPPGAQTVGATNLPVQPQPVPGQQQVGPTPGGFIPEGGVQQQVGPPPGGFPQAPPTGLIGSEQALQAGLTGATGALEQAQALARGDITQALGQGAGVLQGAQQLAGQQFGQGVGALDPFRTTGLSAQQQQAALSGALGADAQRQAFAAFQESPEQAFIREQGQRAVLANAAATGGVQGGNVLRELTRFGTGLASQDIQNRFSRLGALSGQGLTAAGQIGQLRGQQAGLTGQLGQAGAQLIQTGGQNLANIASQFGGNVANLIAGTGQTVAGGRTRAGELIAGQIGGTTSGLADLINQQGGGLANLIGGGAGDLANLIAGLGGGQAASSEQLAQLLANLSTGQAGQVAGLPGVGQFGGQQDPLGNTQALTGALSGILGAIGTGGSQPPPQVGLIGTGQQFASTA